MRPFLLSQTGTLCQVRGLDLIDNCLDNSIADDNLDAVMEILTESKWDDAIDNLRPIRNKFCELVGVPAPAVLKKSAA